MISKCCHRDVGGSHPKILKVGARKGFWLPDEAVKMLRLRASIGSGLAE